MVAKGLDFENVTLVGVLNADQMLYNDDFRSNERAFDLLTQVVGRSGRGKISGYGDYPNLYPRKPHVPAGSRQDYDAFYQSEIQFRHAMLYPPFSDILLFGFVGEQEAAVRDGSYWLLNRLQQLAASEYPELPHAGARLLGIGSR